MEIGRTLKETRESRGISIEAVEEATKIRRRYLEAIEQEKFDLLPGMVYGKGFIKSYANFIGFDASGLISAYEERFQPEVDDIQEKTYTKIERPSRKRYYGIISIAIVLILIVAAVYLPGSASRDSSDLILNNPAGKEAPSQVKPQNQQVVNITLSVTGSPSWMHVEVDGTPAFTGLVPGGEKKEFKGNEKISFTLGNAGVVDVQVNGRKIGVLGGVGQVVTKEYKPGS